MGVLIGLAKSIPLLFWTCLGTGLGSRFTPALQKWYLLPVTGPLSRVQGLKWDNCHESFSTLSFFRSEAELEGGLASGLEARGLRVGMDPVKNRTLIAERRFEPGDFVCEYPGEWIEEAELERRKNSSPANGRYTIMFSYGDQDTFILDAPEDTGHVCRLINHSWKRNNVDYAPVFFNKTLRIVFYARSRIEAGEELLLDYGYESSTKEELNNYSWMNE